MAVSGISAGTGLASRDASRTTIAENFDTFLQILTTQLRHQNPLDPMDTNQFTQQLVQFTSVEQQLKTNQFLEALMLSNQAAVNTDAVSYIGKEVTAAGNRAELRDGRAAWGFHSEANVSDAKVTIKDHMGNVVYSETGSLEQGQGIFEWNGRGSDGNFRPDGTYTITMEGRTLAGNSVRISTATTGIVTEVDFSGAVPVLSVGTSRIALSDVTGVRLPGP